MAPASHACLGSSRCMGPHVHAPAALPPSAGSRSTIDHVLRLMRSAFGEGRGSPGAAPAWQAGRMQPRLSRPPWPWLPHHARHAGGMRAHLPKVCVSACPSPTLLRLPDPLIMGNGRDMLEMVCNSYESPPEDEGGSGEGVEDDAEGGAAEQFDFSKQTPACRAALQLLLACCGGPACCVALLPHRRIHGRRKRVVHSQRQAPGAPRPAGGFRCAALRLNTTIVSVATFR